MILLNEEQLPPHTKEVFKEHRKQFNIQYANVLRGSYSAISWLKYLETHKLVDEEVKSELFAYMFTDNI